MGSVTIIMNEDAGFLQKDFCSPKGLLFLGTQIKNFINKQVGRNMQKIESSDLFQFNMKASVQTGINEYEAAIYSTQIRIGRIIQFPAFASSSSQPI